MELFENESFVEEEEKVDVGIDNYATDRKQRHLSGMKTETIQSLV